MVKNFKYPEKKINQNIHAYKVFSITFLFHLNPLLGNIKPLTLSE